MLRGLDPQRFDEPLHNPGLVQHAPVSWPLVALGFAVLFAMVVPFVVRFARHRPSAALDAPLTPGARGRLPLFGWAGLGLVAVSWACSWGFILLPLRPYAFTPLWVGYTLVVMALTRRATGRSLLDAPKRLLGLTALSAVFWWFFEYLNRFVESWEYWGVSVRGLGDALLFGVLPFATVLPAVAATQELWAGSARLDAAFVSFHPVDPRAPRALGAGVVLAGLGGLLALSWAPTLLFPLVWLAPLLVLVGGQAALGRPHVLSGLARGDWREVVTWALAALTCGFFWEGWNWLSLPRWTYEVSYVGAPKLFEMPLLGYAGYLFFGLECAVVARLVAALPPQR